MSKGSKMLKLFSKTVVATLVLLIVSTALGYGYLNMKIAKAASVTHQVVKLPTQTQPTVDLPSYTGLHPSLLSRPNDPYMYPIPLGEVGPYIPLYSGPLQYPFSCSTEKSGLGQPIVDNQQGIGMPIYQEIDEEKTHQLAGYSKDCLLPTRASYFYNRIGGDDFFPLEEADEDIAQIEVAGRMVDFIMRVETGTINRFPYVIAALKGTKGSLASPDGRHWNKRLIYQFRGGVGIGKEQGGISPKGLLKRRIKQLRKGYAVAYSSGNQTKNHYNIWLAEETALRVKRQFRALYGKDLYTVGVGGSGGAIQQYLIAQNTPDLIDAAIPLYSYPDMITQTQYALDCELLEYYFDVVGADNPRWRSWSERKLVEGTSASTEHRSAKGVLYDLAMLLQKQLPHLFSGSNECVNAWRGLAPRVNNPRYVNRAQRYEKSVFDQVHWSYWDDLKYFLGTDHQGYALQTWDNVGVQYGLKSLLNGKLSPVEFLHLNANIGGWKPPAQMKPEYFWKLGGVGGLLNFSPWGQHNMMLSPDNGLTPAIRKQGDRKAMEAAYRSGQVFIGRVKIPIIDLRHYLDDELDMHHSFASVSTRIRMQMAQGNADNQLIWVARKPLDPVDEAFQGLDRWMDNIAKRPGKSVIQNKPADISDRCYDAQGTLIAEGSSVWDGDWNQRPEGDCTQVYPLLMESRMVAGAPVAGDLFKCQLQTIDTALKRGLYSGVEMMPYLAELKRVFPEGVCDYTKPDLGRPVGLLTRPGNPEALTIPLSPQ